MTICKEQFISALREAVSAEFENIPKSENAIEFSFSNAFNKKMQRLIKSQKSSYWNLIKTVPKRVAIICIAVAAMLCGALCIKPVRVSAEGIIQDIIVKTKNIFQRAYEEGIPLSEVDKDGDFKYTEFKGEERTAEQDESTSSVTGDTFADAKTEIYNKMLNTIDHFNTIELSTDIHMSADEYLTVNSYSNIDKSLAYEAVYDHNRLRFETFCSPDRYTLINVDHSEKTYTYRYLKVYSRSDSPYIPLEERIKITSETGDGLPCYCYRANATNCPMASYSILPEGLTFSYLADFDRWTIADGDVEYLGRRCIKITGTPTPYSGNKHNNDSFMMLADRETGILMKFEGYKNGKVSGCINVTKCVIDGETEIKRFDEKQYSSYKQEDR